jgi:hypothetical protein
MKVFLSYAREDQHLAQAVTQALLAENHEVFFSHEDLKQGDAYNKKIRMEISDSDAFIFLISPDSVQPGRYPLSELEQAVEKWRSEPKRILPFYARDTPTLPSGLPATTVERTSGSLPAKVVDVVARLSGADTRGKKLTAALKVVASVRALDNAIRDHLSPFVAFDLSWSSDRRNDKIDSLVAFASRSAYIVDVRNALEALRPFIHWTAEEEVQSIYNLACDYLYRLGGPGSPTPFKEQNSMLDFFKSIRTASTAEDVDVVRNWAKRTLTVVAPGQIEDEEAKCQKLIASSLESRATSRDTHS